MKNPRQLLNILLATALVASLSACGNKGPLVHPDKVKQAQEQPAQEPAASSN
jgi:predicted small lipoprotein YifL